MGFPQKSEKPLIVNGKDDGNELSWATQLFNIATSPKSLKDGRGRIFDYPKIFKDSSINSSNAPTWTSLLGISGLQFVVTDRNYGISSSVSIIQGVLATLGQLQSTGVSLISGLGGKVDKNNKALKGQSKSHDGGRGIDIEVPPKEVFDPNNIPHGTLFFAEIKKNGEWYVATGNNQIIIKDGQGYKSGNPNNVNDLARGLTTKTLIAGGAGIVSAVSEILVRTYNFENAKEIVSAFKSNGSGKIFFNDPKTWSSGAEFLSGHWGHIHAEIPALSSTNKLRANSLAIPINDAAADLFLQDSSSTNSNAISFSVLSTSPSVISANELGAFEGDKNLTGTLNATNTEQYYRFILGNPVNTDDFEGQYFVTLRNFSLLLNGLSNDVDVEVIRDYNEDVVRQDDEVIASSETVGNSPESLNITDLPEDVYYIRVFQKSGDTTYNLTLSIPPLPVPTNNAGDTVNTAKDLGVIGNNVQLSDFIGQVDSDDYYSGYQLSEIQTYVLSR